MPDGSKRTLELADEILSLLEEAHARTSTELRSESGGDSVVWAIISGFLVSVAANLFTKGLPNLGQKHLSERDLSEMERVFIAVAERHHELQRQEIESAVDKNLPRYLSTGERRHLTFLITDAIIRSCRKQNNP